MKPYVAKNPFGAVVVVLSSTQSLLHSHERGLIIMKPVACVKSKDPLEVGILHMKALAMFSGAESDALEKLRELTELTRHETTIIERASAQLSQWRVRNAAKDKPKKPKAIIEQLALGKTDAQIWDYLCKDYGLYMKEQPATMRMIAKLRSKPQKRTTRKKG